MTQAGLSPGTGREVQKTGVTPLRSWLRLCQPSDARQGLTDAGPGLGCMHTAPDPGGWANLQIADGAAARAGQARVVRSDRPTKETKL